MVQPPTYLFLDSSDLLSRLRQRLAHPVVSREIQGEGRGKGGAGQLWGVFSWALSLSSHPIPPTLFHSLSLCHGESLAAAPRDGGGKDSGGSTAPVVIPPQPPTYSRSKRGSRGLQRKRRGREPSLKKPAEGTKRKTKSLTEKAPHSLLPSLSGEREREGGSC